MPAIPPIKIRGVRQTVPPGYVAGRIGASSGDMQLIPLNLLGAHLVASGAVPPKRILHPALGFYGQGLFAANEQIDGAVAPQTVLFPSQFAGISSTATAKTAPHGNVTFYLCNNVVAYLAGGAPNGCVAEIQFTAGHLVGTVTWLNNPITLAVAGIWILVLPAVPDGALAGVQCLFIGDPE